jgi:hypothetical protein
MAEVVRNIEVAVRAGGDVGGIFKTRLSGIASIAFEALQAVAGDRLDRPIRSDLPNARPIEDKNISAGIHRNRDSAEQFRSNRRPAVAAWRRDRGWLAGKRRYGAQRPAAARKRLNRRRSGSRKNRGKGRAPAVLDTLPIRSLGHSAEDLSGDLRCARDRGRPNEGGDEDCRGNPGSFNLSCFAFLHEASLVLPSITKHANLKGLYGTRRVYLPYPLLHKKAREACAVTVGAVYDRPKTPNAAKRTDCSHDWEAVTEHELRRFHSVGCAP